MVKNISILRLRKILSEFGKNGFKGVIKYSGERLVRRFTYLGFETKLPVEVISNCIISDLIIRRANNSEEDINKLVVFWVSFYIPSYPLYNKEKQIRNVIESRLKAGELCFVAEVQGEIVYFTWASLYNKCRLNKHEPLRYLDFVPLKSAYLYNTFTHPEYIRKGLVFAVKKYEYKYLSDLGCEKVIVCINEDNIASIKMQKDLAKHKFNLRITRFAVFNKTKIDDIE